MSNKKSHPISVSTVEQRLKELKEVPARDPLKASSGRARFLRQAAEYRQAVSPDGKARQRKWIFLRPIRKEKLAMNALVALILVVSLILGGGATVAAAQDDLPNEPLYGLKLWTEDITLSLKDDPEEQADQLLDMAGTRLEEIDALEQLDITPPEEVSERLEEHLDQALELAGELDDATFEQMLQDFDEIMQYHEDGDLEALRAKVREMLDEHLNMVGEDLPDFEEIHNEMQEQMKEYGYDEEAIQDWMDEHPMEEEYSIDDFNFDNEDFNDLLDVMFEKSSMLEAHEWNSENGFNFEDMEKYQMDFQNDGSGFGHNMDWGKDMDWGSGGGWDGFH